MLSKSKDHTLLWKKVSEGIDVTHFSSVSNSEQIYIKRMQAKKSTKNPVTIFLFHDLASYHGRFLNLVYWFRAHHPTVSFIMMDYVGHGLSSGTRGHISQFSDLVDDMAQAFLMIEKKSDEKWVALGQGLGGLCVLDLLNNCEEAVIEKIDKVILSNFFLNFPSPVLQMQNTIYENFAPLESAMKTSRLIEIYKPEEILSDSRQQGVYLEDPLIVRRPTYQTLKIIMTKVKGIFQDAYFLDKPTLLLKSESPYLLSRGTYAFAKGLKKGILTEKKYSNLKHDLYNEKNNKIVFSDIAEWVQS